MHCVANMLILYNQKNNPSINPTNAFDIQRFSHLDVPTKYQHVSGITILIPMGRFLIPLSIRCLLVTINTHASTYIAVHHLVYNSTSVQIEVS